MASGEKVDRVDMLSWIRPNYLNLDWQTNRFPTPHKELTRDEFDLLRDHGTYSLGGISYDSVVFLPDQPEEMQRGIGGYSVHYYFWFNQAIAIADRYMQLGEYAFNDKYPVGKGDFLPRYPNEEQGDHSYGYARRYFRIGCSHNWKELSQEEARANGILHHGNCYHVNKCIDCGLVWSYDSSG